jgi:RNA polymerase sigma-70 factor (ECF subfamily)
MADTLPTASAAASDLGFRGRVGVAQPVSSAAESFEQLVADHRQRVARLAYRLLGWRDEVEDVVQDVFVSAFANMDRFRADSSVSTWLTAITVNKCRSHLRRRFLRIRWLADARRAATVKRGAAAEVEALDRESFEQVRRAVRALPDRDREVIVLRYLEEMPVSEMAAVLGASRNAVEVRLSRARARLNAVLGGLLDE